jgi:hypothetical protein
MFFLSGCGGNLISEHGARRRMPVTFVAGKATDGGVAFKILLIDSCRHLDHLAGGLLFFLVVGVKLTLNVTESTWLPNRPRKIAHLADELRGGQIL